MNRMIFGLVAMAAILLGSCNDEPVANVTFTLVPVHNGTPIEAGQIVQDVTGRNFTIEQIRAYITDLRLFKDNGESILISGLSLVNWPGSGSDISNIIPKDAYQGIEFKIGLDPVTNESDPTSFAQGDPLSDDQDMHLGPWDYAFLSVDGMVDTSPSGDQMPTELLSYNLGRNILYSPVEINQFFDVSGTIIFFSLEFEVSHLFNGTAGNIDISTHRINNSGDLDMPNAVIIMSNFVEALELN